MANVDDFSYANLQSMWSQRDKATTPLSLKPPTACRASLGRSDGSPQRRPIVAVPRRNYKKSTNQRYPSSSEIKDAGNVRLSVNNVTKRTTDSIAFKSEDAWNTQKNKIEREFCETAVTHVVPEGSDLSSECFIDGHSYEEDITKNLMRTNANDLSNPSADSTDEEIRPRQLWQDSDSWSADSELDRGGNSAHINETPFDFGERIESGVDSKCSNEKHLSGSNWGLKHNDIFAIDSYSRLDPYDRFESMSTVNSDVTVKAENKQATALINALQKKKERNISVAFDKQYEGDSNIPDAAFEQMAAKLTNNITGIRNKPSEIKKTLEPQTKGRNVIQSSDMEEKRNEEVLEKPGSLYHNVPRGPLKGANVAESDVFDGLSDVASSVPSFCRGFFPSELASFKAAIPKNKQKSDICLGSQESKKNGSDYIPERSEEAKKKLSKNLAAFAKTNSPPRSPSGRKRMNLKIPKPKERNALAFNPRVLESVEENSSQGNSQDSEENEPMISGSPIGIARVDQDNTDASLELSRHFELFRASPEPIAGKVVSQEDTTEVTPKNDLDTEKSDDEDSPFERDTIYPGSDNNSNIATMVTWIPSMLRLYIRRTKTGSSPLKIHASPTSVMSFSNRNDGVQLSDCRMNGLGTIRLHNNQEYGGDIKDPTSLISNMKPKIDENTKHKLRLCIDDNSGVKRIKSKRKRKDIFDKAVEVHERALSLFEIGRLEDALDMYESFFECYSRKEFLIEDRHEEKHIISNFLFNMGMVYAKMGDCHLSSDFFNEALATLEQIDFDDSCSKEIDVSISLQINRMRFDEN